jgi:uncharacterized membrane protein YbaN (DUF454 family)
MISYIKGIIGYVLTILLFIIFLLLHMVTFGNIKPTETDWFERFGEFLSKYILGK